MKLKLKIKKLVPEAVVPKYAKSGDAGLDLTVVSKNQTLTRNGIMIEYGTGLAVEIPEGYVGLIFPRSSISKTGLQLTNCVGVIDSGYRGEIKFKFRDVSNSVGQIYNIGDRVGQLIVMPYPEVELEEVIELTSTERGEGGFGSSGN